MPKTKECSKCGNKNKDEQTSIIDRGVCTECYKKWQNGELCLLCDKSDKSQNHDEDCIHNNSD